MKIDIKWAELHNPLFLGGTNLQTKLDPTKRTGLAMEYDEDKETLFVTWNNQTARVPVHNVSSMIEGKVEVIRPIRGAVSGPIKAQVSTPQDHVFAGLKGK